MQYNRIPRVEKMHISQGTFGGNKEKQRESIPFFSIRSFFFSFMLA